MQTPTAIRTYCQRTFRTTKKEHQFKKKYINDFLDRQLPQESNNNKTNNILITIVIQNKLKKPYSDQTRKSPFISLLRNNYVFVMYNYITNTISTEPLLSRQAKPIADAWEEYFNTLKNSSHAPEIHIIDNECSAEI